MHIQFGPDHEAHRRIPWPTELQNIQVDLPSSLLPHLSCNTALGSLECNHVKELRDKLRTAEKLANEKKRRLQDELAQTQAELEQLAKQVFACDVALAPVRALPHDILYQVFRCLPVYTPPPKVHIPTGLSHVCTSWRDVVSGMPHLWRLIRLQDRQSISVSEGLLTHFGRLSGSQPLTIEIDEALPIEDNRNFSVLRWVLTAWRDRNRLHTLGISMAMQDSLIQELLSLPDIPLSLQILRHQNPAHHDSQFSRADVSDVSTLLDRFPELTALWLCVPKHIRRYRFAEDIQRLQSWAKLTRVFLDGSSTFLTQLYFWNLLQVCPNLEVAYLAIQTLEWKEVPRRSEVLVHNNLRELGLYLDLEGVNMYSVLSCCCFPRVTSLHLYVAEMHVFAIEDPVTAIRVFPSLQSLVLSPKEQDLTQDVLRSILSPLSTITDLTILYVDSPASLENIICLAQPMPVVGAEAGSVSSSHLAPSLSNVYLRFLIHEPTVEGWDNIRLENYDSCMKRIIELRSRPSIRSLSVECVQWPEDVIKGALTDDFDSDVASLCIEAQKAMEELCTELGEKLEEIEDGSDVNVDIRVVKSTGHFPPTPAVDHFLPYFGG
ncbi:hypothetical protein BJ165DRAFT_1530595 [Panaeolus papilionaceus]|nr:hypothetical protein BJ165DRAFT_1530595 [Panaeolus papilionaceus]